MKILILGGYGVFGGRLCELIADVPDIEVLVCGRSLKKAQISCEKRAGSAAQFHPLAFDRANIEAALDHHLPDLVIDASGPFQNYGDDPYVVIKACLKTATHYLDLADAADFVFGVSQFDKAAQEAGVVILSGVSSFPVLTAAVLREFQKHMTVHSLSGGIAPSPYAGVGLNVMKAVISYAGDPVKLLRDGKPATGVGLADNLRYTIAPPGYKPLKNIHFSLVDVPDLQVIPAENPELKNIWMGAGPVPEYLHKILNGIARLRSWLPIPSYAPFAPLFFRILNLMKFGEHRGGMFVEAKGERGGQPVTRSWHLLAEGDDGPYIPSMACEALIRKWVNGEMPIPGARAASQALDLSDYEALFAKRTIYTGFRNDNVYDSSVFEQTLQSAFANLPPSIQAIHQPATGQVWSGKAEIISGRNPIGKLVARILGLPAKAKNCPVSVTFLPSKDGQKWDRDFDGHKFSSTFTKGHGKNEHLLIERLGPVQVALAMIKDGERLHFTPRRWSFLGIPMPQFLLPREESFECEEEGVFHFNVAVRVPIAGLIVAYKGWLQPETQEEDHAPDYRRLTHYNYKPRALISG